jgi:Uma2 family endonuclease
MPRFFRSAGSLVRAPTTAPLGYTEELAMEPARRLATYDDLLALPAAARGEVLGGDIVTAPAPLPRHAFVASSLAGEIGTPFGRGRGGGPGGWWILPEVDVRLGSHDIVRPDLSGWRRERLPAPWNTRPIDVVPDWVCEILSPSSAQLDTVTKARLYAAKGVRHYWLVDPAARTLEARVLREGQWLVLGSYTAEDRACIEPFEAVELELALIFPPELPATEGTPI